MRKLPSLNEKQNSEKSKPKTACYMGVQAEFTLHVQENSETMKYYIIIIINV